MYVLTGQCSHPEIKNLTLASIADFASFWNLFANNSDKVKGSSREQIIPK
jgi:hypothetical protein